MGRRRSTMAPRPMKRHAGAVAPDTAPLPDWKCTPALQLRLAFALSRCEVRVRGRDRCPGSGRRSRQTAYAPARGVGACSCTWCGSHLADFATGARSVRRGGMAPDASVRTPGFCFEPRTSRWACLPVPLRILPPRTACGSDTECAPPGRSAVPAPALGRTRARHLADALGASMAGASVRLASSLRPAHRPPDPRAAGAPHAPSCPVAAESTVVKAEALLRAAAGRL